MKIFILTILLFISSLLFSNDINNSDYFKLIDPNGNIYYLGQKIDNIEKIIGKPDKIEIFEFKNREKDQYDTIEWIYNIGISFRFSKGYREVFRISVSNPIFTTLVGFISPTLSTSSDIFNKFDVIIDKNNYKGLNYYSYRASLDYMGEDFLYSIEFEVSDFKNNGEEVINKIEIYANF